MTFAAPSAIVRGGRKWMPFSAVDFLQALTAGILIGSAYALMCIGLGIIFGSMNVIGLELLEGLLFSVANWPLKGQAEFIQRFKKRTGEPFLTQDGLCGYGHTWILKEALESAGAADKLKVADAIRKMNLITGPAALSFPGPIKFDERGRRQDVPMIFAQWQQGVPVTVYPEDRALAKQFWPSV
jgi:branched-chain amino acid transport system substrate-binding protein